MIYKIVRLNALTADDKHYLLNRDILTQPIQMQLSQKEKTFSEFLLGFLESILNFKDWQKNLILIADVNLEIHAPKSMVK